MQHLRHIFVPVLLVLLGLTLPGTRIASADSVITNCANDSQLTTALANGGNIAFSCGTEIITFSGQKTISVDTTIDGGGKITFNGANSTRLFYVNAGTSLTLNNLVLTNGYSDADYGGAVYVDSATLTLNKTTIQKSRTKGFAGGAIISFTGNVTLNDSVIQNNASNYGAVNATGTLTINRSVFQDNTATDGGAAVSAGGTINIHSGVFRNNKATNTNSIGGAILTLGSITLQESSLSANQAGSGGGIYVAQGATLVMDSSTISGNSSTKGGGIFNFGTITLIDVALDANKATSQGAGIHNGDYSAAGTATLKEVTLSNNSGVLYGGGIFNDRGTMTLTNVTLSGNVASSHGGGIFNNGTPAIMDLTNVTLANNSGFVGGIHSFGGAVTMKNTLFAKGSRGANCSNVGGGSFNMSDDISCGFGVGGDGVTLNLGPLSYNGSSIQTHLPQMPSPAIDGGTSGGAPGNDGRGNSRPQGFAYDVGAVEVCSVAPDKPTLTTPANNTKAKGLQVALDWYDTPCADKYKVTIKDAATGIKVQGGTSPTSGFKTAALVKGKTYKWIVQACNTVDCTKSDSWKFSVK